MALAAGDQYSTRSKVALVRSLSTRISTFEMIYEMTGCTHACTSFSRQGIRTSYINIRKHAFAVSLISYRLKQIDIEVMKHLHKRVNLIPVIAKSDTMEFEEIQSFKARVGTDHYLTNILSLIQILDSH